MIYKKIIENIKNASNIAIFSHINSDPDAIGSSIALKLALESLNKNVAIFIEEPIHTNFDFLETKKHVNNSNIQSFDLAIGLDSPEPKRFGKNMSKFYKIKNSINIDHHLGNANYAKLNLVDVTSSSTANIIFNLLNVMKIEITSEIATCLYAGLCGDTGRFKHNNTTGKDFIVASKLYNHNADLQSVNFNLFSRMSVKEFNLLKLALNKAEFSLNGKFALICLNIKDFISTDTNMENTHFLIDYLMNIDGVKIAVVMSQEKQEEFKVSVRSRDSYCAQNIAKCFGGGGHFYASGCRIFNREEIAKERIIEAVMQEDKRCTE